MQGVVPSGGSDTSFEQSEQRARADLRDARARRRMRQVLDAAVRLMHGRDPEAVSMQALAEEASVSVGLIYKYFGGKEEVLVAIVLDLVDQLRDEMAARMAAAGPDPVARLAAGFAAYCAVMDDRHAVGLLTFRESAELGPQARQRLKDAERTTHDPLREAAVDAAAAGLLVDEADPDLLAFDLAIIAQTWPLKHWHFPEDYDIGRYVEAQTSAMLRSVLTPEAYERHRTTSRGS